MLQFFNMSATDAAGSFHRVSTRAEMERVLGMDSVRSPQMVQVIEIIMDKVDVPWRLSAQVAMQRDEAALQAMAAAGFKMHRVPGGEGNWH
jgi:pyruvate decarboxylase